ncbi:diguanylate cyclase (GGDEF)-like protein [Actinoplanes lutulentus]|uniref:Diguanylate cyclase (GGDEF)-like protein n=1 Tax=Actinoplanes lutulentus TaxID=1287878 RepID=A0A327ZAG1_9ACTN|nr:GGDEF domain-containing protein [Actinoplanes lutulentus]MBB2946312.1 diguanylate cyclase (GGDEF)-like protein [Actinoplanes lutulentus]RAK28749.1 diguanylate cyclase (GGDEF)-like protein [Actinoplanes lutulentus]
MLATGYGFAAAMMIVIGVRLHAPRNKAPWYSFAAALTLWATGDLCYAWQPSSPGWPLTQAADVPYLLSYPAFIFGAQSLLRTRSASRGRAETLDAAIVSTGFTLLTWAFVIRPIMDDSTLTTAQRLLELAYPAGDVLLFIMTVRLLTASEERTTSHRLLIGAILAQSFYDLWYTATSNLDVNIDAVVDVAGIPTYTLWAAAALHRSMNVPAAPAQTRVEGHSPRRLVLLAVATLLAPAVLAAQGMSGGGVVVDWPAITISSVVLFLLVVWRMSGLVTQLQTQAAQLRTMAHNDALTGIPNRRAWDLELSNRMASARRSGDSLTVALLDIDHFKRYNDAFGHPAGDQLLRDGAAAWRAHLGAGGLLARYGGEEFAVLFTGCHLDEAIAVLDRMRRATPSGQSFSAGLAVWGGQESPEALISRADEALYGAKEAGRNRVEVSTTLPAAA